MENQEGGNPQSLQQELTQLISDFKRLWYYQQKVSLSSIRLSLAAGVPYQHIAAEIDRQLEAIIQELALVNAESLLNNSGQQ